jgi:phage terminase large subunit-like protein
VCSCRSRGAVVPVEHFKNSCWPYVEWIRDGLITPTPGTVTDQRVIRRDINRLASDYRVGELPFDPWNSTKLSTKLSKNGLRLLELRQGFRSLSEPTEHLGALVSGASCDMEAPVLLVPSGLWI